MLVAKDLQIFLYPIYVPVKIGEHYKLSEIRQTFPQQSELERHKSVYCLYVYRAAAAAALCSQENSPNDSSLSHLVPSCVYNGILTLLNKALTLASTHYLWKDFITKKCSEVRIYNTFCKMTYKNLQTFNIQ